MDELMLFAEVEAYSGGGQSAQEVQELAKALDLEKALTVGYGMEPSTQTGWGAGRIESLENTVKFQTPKVTDAALYQEINKGKAGSTVEEYVVFKKLGAAGFYAEGGAPEEYDEEIAREFEQVKFIGALAKIPMPAVITPQIYKPIDTLTKAKVEAIIRHANVKLYWGDSNKIPLEWNGYYEQLTRKCKYPDQHIIDKKGEALTPEDFNLAGTIIRVNGKGNPGNLKSFISPGAMQSYVDELIANKQWFAGSTIQDIYVKAANLSINMTKVKLVEDLFLQHKGENYLEEPHPKLNSDGSAFAAMSSKAPDVLAAGTCAVTLYDLPAGKSLEVGDYDYAVVPVNNYGPGKAFAVSASVTAGKGVKFSTLADNGSTYPATCFDIYRKPSATSSLKAYQYLTTFKVGDAADVRVDDGSEIPGTTTCFVFEWDFDQTINYKQLLPMTKMNLAITQDSLPWMQKQYAVPLLYNANRVVVFKNCKTGFSQSFGG